MDNSQDFDDFPDMPELLAQANDKQVALNRAKRPSEALRGALVPRRAAKPSLSGVAVRRRK
jgi:hypothetical protein